MKNMKILALGCILLNAFWAQSAMARSEEEVKAIKDYYEKKGSYSQEKVNICRKA